MSPLNFGNSILGNLGFNTTVGSNIDSDLLVMGNDPGHSICCTGVPNLPLLLLMHTVSSPIELNLMEYSAYFHPPFLLSH